MTNYHIIKEGTLWKLTPEDGDLATLTANSKAEILKRTQEYMQNRTGTVKIYTENGRIQQERTYPRPDNPRESTA